MVNKKVKGKRAKEFLSCLGRGKGMITEEDENPEDYNYEIGKTSIYTKNLHLKGVLSFKTEILRKIKVKNKARGGSNENKNTRI
jgi:hypothetical protein